MLKLFNLLITVIKESEIESKVGHAKSYFRQFRNKLEIHFLGGYGMKDDEESPNAS
jgi:hypothetical protein